MAGYYPENPNKSDIYESFKVWESMPAVAKKLIRDSADEKQLSREGLTEEDLQVFELAHIRTRTEFSEKFGVDPDTLTAWGKKLYQDNEHVQAINEWAKRLSKNVYMALYRSAVRKGDAREVKLWAQTVDGWSEKATVEHKFVPIGSVVIESIPARDVEVLPAEAV